jgi:hypothetical protein
MVGEDGQVILDPQTREPKMFSAEIEERDDYKVIRRLHAVKQ